MNAYNCMGNSSMKCQEWNKRIMWNSSATTIRSTSFLTVGLLLWMQQLQAAFAFQSNNNNQMFATALLRANPGYHRGHELYRRNKSSIRVINDHGDISSSPSSIETTHNINGVVSSGGSSIASVTTRLPLGTIFDSRDYIFTAVGNIRGYEWGEAQVDELFDDLAYSPQGFSNRPAYELNQIILVPVDWDTESYGLGNRYAVYDGQQRLVTLCLLLAALRESFREQEDHPGTYDETVAEIAAMLNPPKVRKIPLVRIELRARENAMLHKILLPELVGNRIDLPENDGDGTTVDDKNALNPTDRRVLANFRRLRSRVGELTVKEQLALLDFLVERVYVLACIPETASIARNIVMAQGRGLNNEPIDDFKGLVCFRYIQDERLQYKTFDDWDSLAGEPDPDKGSVGRETIASACLLRAASSLRTKLSKNNQVTTLEKWLQKDLAENNCEGNDIFEREIRPSSIALLRFRFGLFESFTLFADHNVINTRLGKTVLARLRFLRGLTTNVASARDIEMIMLELLLRVEFIPGFQPMFLKEFDDCLRCVELIALWMAITKPSAIKRQERCFQVLDAIQNSSDNCNQVLEESISADELMTLKGAFFWYKYGDGLTGRKIAAVILERLNSHAMILDGNVEIPDVPATHWQVEFILPKSPSQKYWLDNWPNEKERNEWTSLLGNLALLSSKSTARQASTTFPSKKERFANEIWPLTQALSIHTTWNRDAMLEQEAELLELVEMVWNI